ncbi:MAG: hypothetical protein ACK5KK_04845, partial [Microbacterium sp.]
MRSSLRLLALGAAAVALTLAGCATNTAVSAEEAAVAIPSGSPVPAAPDPDAPPGTTPRPAGSQTPSPADGQTPSPADGSAPNHTASPAPAPSTPAGTTPTGSPPASGGTGAADADGTGSDAPDSTGDRSDTATTDASGTTASTATGTVIGNGRASSCTSAAVVAAVAKGGVITFDCGSKPVTIPMAATAKVVNTSPNVVLDGGGKITLDGQDKRRILYLNTCDKAQVWTTSHCQNQAEPTLTIRGMTFTRGNATGQTIDGGGGGAVFARGGQVTIRNSTFTRNRCDATGQDVAGGAVRVLSQYNGRPVIVSGSTFTANRCSNGGATASIGVSWAISNSVFTGNEATGRGANPA